MQWKFYYRDSEVLHLLGRIHDLVAAFRVALLLPYNITGYLKVAVMFIGVSRIKTDSLSQIVRLLDLKKLPDNIINIGQCFTKI